MFSAATDLRARIPALTRDSAAELMDSLTAAVPRLAANDDPAARDATLIDELAGLHPRDLEEAMLAAQVVVASHAAFACMCAAAQHPPGSREASRLRRDAATLQLAIGAAQRALHRSRERPMLADAAGTMRPTVPTRQAQSPARRNGAAAEASAPPEPFPPPGVFDNLPHLKQLDARWTGLPRWEDMSMQERREVWGYHPEPLTAPPSNDAAPTLQ